MSILSTLSYIVGGAAIGTITMIVVVNIYWFFVKKKIRKNIRKFVDREMTKMDAEEDLNLFIENVDS